MSREKEILDEFGSILVKEIVDPQYAGIKDAVFNGFKAPIMECYNPIFEKLGQEEKELLKTFIVKNNHSILFDFLRIFEENQNFKINFEKDGQKIDLVKASEMLKGELIIENGWIDRFSKEVGKDEII